MKPLMSVVVPLYNAERFIAHTLKALQHQSLESFEAIIIDDGSTDRSASRVEALVSKDERFRLMRQANAGVSVTRNRGAALAQSDIIAFLDADDLWHPDFLAKMHAFLKASPEVVIGYAGVRFMDSAGHPTGAYARPYRKPPTVIDLLAGNPTTTCSNLVVRRAEYLASGGFKSGLNHAEDQLWLLEMLLKGHAIAGIAEVLVDYRANDAGLSANTRAMAKGWDELARHAMSIAPAVVGPALPSARAANRLYLAQRALRTRRDVLTAVHHSLVAARSHLPTVAAEALRLVGKASSRILKKGYYHA